MSFGAKEEGPAKALLWVGFVRTDGVGHLEAGRAAGVSQTHKLGHRQAEGRARELRLCDREFASRVRNRGVDAHAGGITRAGRASLIPRLATARANVVVRATRDRAGVRLHEHIGKLSWVVLSASMLERRHLRVRGRACRQACLRSTGSVPVPVTAIGWREEDLDAVSSDFNVHVLSGVDCRVAAEAIRDFLVQASQPPVVRIIFEAASLERLAETDLTVFMPTGVDVEEAKVELACNGCRNAGAVVYEPVLERRGRVGL